MRSSYSNIIEKYVSKRKKNSDEVPSKCISTASGRPAGETLPFRDTSNLCLTSAVLGVLCVTWGNQGEATEQECAYKRFGKCQQMACLSPQQWGLRGGGRRVLKQQNFLEYPRWLTVNMILNIKISEEVMLGKEKVKDPKLMNILRKGFVWVIKKIYLCNSQKSQFL